MIDGFKLFVKIDHFDYDFIEKMFPLSVKYGEVLNDPREVDYRGLKLKLVPDIGIQIRGSLHSFYNNGNPNSDSFPFKNCLEAINTLSSMISPVIAEVHLQNMEFGVNIVTDDVTRILNSAFLYGSKPFQSRISKNMNYRECPMSEQKIKMYDKGLQHNMNINILRFEKRLRTSRAINKTGIYCLNDLFNIENQQSLVNELNEASSRFTLLDQDFPLDVLTEKERLFYLEFSNPRRWLRGDFNSYQKRRKRIRISNLVKRYSNNSFQELFQSLVKESTEALFDRQ